MGDFITKKSIKRTIAYSFLFLFIIAMFYIFVPVRNFNYKYDNDRDFRYSLAETMTFNNGSLSVHSSKSDPNYLIHKETGTAVSDKKYPSIYNDILFYSSNNGLTKIVDNKDTVVATGEADKYVIDDGYIAYQRSEKILSVCKVTQPRLEK